MAQDGFLAFNKRKQGDAAASTGKAGGGRDGDRLLAGIWRYVKILAASVLYSAGVSLFFDANEMAPGGVTGIAIILSRLLPVETGTLIFLLNLPILLLGARKFGVRFIVSTVYCTAMVSLFTNLWKLATPPKVDLLIAAVAGGILTALGMGIVFRAHATTGGIDIIIKILREHYPHMRTGTLFLCCDAAVIALGGMVFRNLEMAMYAAIGVFVSTTVMDYVLYGKDEAKLIFVISDKNDSISDRILTEIRTGVTLLEGKGAYSGRDKQIIMCVVRKAKGAKIETIVRETDERAFLIISSAKEIYGEGYKSYLEQKL
ncbi:MAG: YitT family protein [Lachnospiraceae bacterium]|nr:YitT family protein [Lachnospiraceae bacterium]